MSKKFNCILITILSFASLILFFGIIAFQILLQPRRQTFQHGKEMAQAIQYFREVEFALDTRLNPNLILSVTTEDYLPTFLELNKSGMCEQCDRFWVISSAEIERIRVIKYTPTVSLVRAEVTETGYRINSRNYERMTPHGVVQTNIATYVFLRESPNNPWLLDDIQDYDSPNYMNPSMVTLDDYLLFDLDEIKSDKYKGGE